MAFLLSIAPVSAFGVEGGLSVDASRLEQSGDVFLPPEVAPGGSLLRLGGHMPYMSGYGNGLFGPDRRLSRAEAAQILYTLLKEKPASVSRRFSDVPANAWFAKAVNGLAQTGVVSGVGGGRFDPERSVTRAEFVTMVCGCFSLPESTADFSDVPKDHWAYRFVAQAASAGWIAGREKGRFEPDSPILRCEAVVVLNAALGRTQDKYYAAQRETQLFSDVPKTHWAYLAVSEAASPVMDPVDVPVLMYHHLVQREAEVGPETITVGQFRSEMALLAQNGYTPVSVEEMIAFVTQGKALPEKPVCITFDDGYLSVYELAFPVLLRYGFKATVFPIGSSIGKRFYKDTSIPITPHFSFDEMARMAASGLISVQSHGYDMHQTAEYETTQLVRPNMCCQPWESDAHFAQALWEDHARFCAEVEPVTGQDVVAVAYPTGAYQQLTEDVLRGQGVEATFATTRGKARLIPGDETCLYHMKRLGVAANLSEAAFLALLK